LAFIAALMIPHLEHLSSSGAFPIFITVIMIISTICILWNNRKRYAALPLGEELRQAQPFSLPKIIIIYTAILLTYILLTARLHFVPSTYLFLAGSFIFLKGGKTWKMLLIAALMLAVIYVLFQTIFNVFLW
jgi:hypothetical protein